MVFSDLSFLVHYALFYFLKVSSSRAKIETHDANGFPNDVDNAAKSIHHVRGTRRNKSGVICEFAKIST